MPGKGYEFFEHTADTGMVVRGDTLEQLLTNAAQGVVELLVESSPVIPTETRMIALSASSAEGLLRAWLKELLFWFETERFLPGDCHFDAISDTELRGRIVGERFDPRRHQAGAEIKGVTYHQFQVDRTPDGWQARIIFDL